MSARAEALDHLVRGIVDAPDDVRVTEKSTRRGPLLEVRVAPAASGVAPHALAAASVVVSGEVSASSYVTPDSVTVPVLVTEK